MGAVVTMAAAQLPAQVAPTASAHAVNRELRQSARDLMSFTFDQDYEQMRSVTVDARASDADRAAAIAVIEASLRPCDKRVALAELTRLRLETVSRQQDQIDQAAQTRLYLEYLATYPADVVVTACREGGWKFWPARIELTELCDKLVSQRHTMLAALRVPIAPKATEKPRRPPTAEEIAYVEAVCKKARAEIRATGLSSQQTKREAQELPPVPPGEIEYLMSVLEQNSAARGRQRLLKLPPLTPEEEGEV